MTTPHYLKTLSIIIVSFAGLANVTATAKEDIGEMANREFSQQQQRIDQKEKQTVQARVALEQPKQKQPLVTKLYDNETPCFEIKAVFLKQPKKMYRLFDSVLNPLKHGEHAILGKCLGEKSLQYAQSIVQSELIRQGFITSKVVIEPQNLASQQLIFTLYPGKVNQILKHKDNKGHVNTFTTVTARPSQVLNLRDVETSLENLRIPSSVTAHIDIQPAESVTHADSKAFGYSDLVIKYNKARPVKIHASIDDAGSQATGKYQATLGFSVDNPLFSSDVFRLEYGHALDQLNNTGLGASNNSIYAAYIVPIRNLQFSVNYNTYNYHQMLLGLHSNLKYEGRSKQGQVKLSWLAHRDRLSRTSLHTSSYYKQSKNFVDGLEVLVQRRKTAGWTAGISHQRSIAKGTLNLGLTHKQGTAAFGSKASPESNINHAEASPQFRMYRAAAYPTLLTVNAAYQEPFSIAKQNMHYHLAGKAQWTHNKLIPQDQFSLGGRYSVRGFSGKSGVSGNKGATLQQTVSWHIPNSYHQLYWGLDRGWVSGGGVFYQQNHQLIGSVLGFKAYYPQASLDGFIGKGLLAPDTVNKAFNMGFKLNYQF